MAINKIIDNVIEAEGGSKMTDDPTDRGGRTQYGISEKAHPEAWVDNKVTEEEARAIYRRKYVEGPGFDKLDEPLRSQMVDFGVPSGPYIATRTLQEIVGATPDGKLGSQTLAAVMEKSTPSCPECGASKDRKLNNALVVRRCLMFARIVQRDKSQARFIVGWINRALSFLK